MRSWFGIGLLVALLLLGFGAGYLVERFHQPTAQYLEQAAQAALEDEVERAVSLSRQAEDRWRRYYNRTAALTDHNPMDQIDNLFAEAKVLAEAEQWQALAACCSQLAVLMRSVCEDQILTWWNLL